MPRGKRTKRKATDAQRRAGAENFKKLEEARKARKERGPVYPPRGERWKALLSGNLSVKELDDEELERLQLRRADGTFSGNQVPVPSHIIQKMRQERIRRGNELAEKNYGKMMQVMMDLAEDEDVQPNVRIKAAQFLVERSGGKTPEVVRVEGHDEFGEALREALDMDREMTEE